MKYVIKVTLLAIFLSVNCGCVGLLMSPFKDASIKTAENFNIETPLKITKKEAGTIRSVAVLSEAEFISDMPPEIRLMYKYSMDVLTTGLEKGKRFKVIYPNTVMKKAADLNIKLDPIRMTDKEFAESITDVAKALKVDSIVHLDIKQEKIEMGKAFATVVFVGTADVPMTVILKMMPGLKGSNDILWMQEQSAVLTAGQLGLKNTPPDEMKKMASALIQPVVSNLMQTF